jgi:hypothetical protein
MVEVVLGMQAAKIPVAGQPGLILGGQQTMIRKGKKDEVLIARTISVAAPGPVRTNS